MSKKHFVILGAGISGLALGWFLKRRFQDDISLTILEKDARAGGWIRTIEFEDFLFEEGPRSCRSKGAGVATLQLIEELGLAQNVISASPHSQKRFLYFESKLQPLPTGLISFLSSPLMRGMLPALWKEWKVPPNHLEDESVYEFISRRLSADIAERLIDPMTSGIYAGDIRQLSIRACFPKMYEWEQVYGSLIQGALSRNSKNTQYLSPFVKTMLKSPIFSFKDGMETLIHRLTAQLGDALSLNSNVKNIKIQPDKVDVICENGTAFGADHVFLAIPSAVAASLFNPSLHVQWDKTPATSVVVVNVGWKRKLLKQEGFGHLIPSSQKEDVLGMVWDSSVFPQQNRSAEETRVTVMLGGARKPDLTSLSENKFIEYALDAIERQLGIEANPDALQVKLACNAIPQYHVGHLGRLSSLEQSLKKISPHLTLLGSAWYGVAVNDCIAKAKAIAQQANLFY